VRRADARTGLHPLSSGDAGVSRHRRRSLVLALAGIVLAALGLGRLGSGPAAQAPSGRRVVRVVAVRSVAAGAPIAAADLGTVRIPAVWASPHQLADPAAAIGRRTAVGLVVGAPVMDAEVVTVSPPPAARELALRLDDAAGLPAGDLADVRGDVYLTPPGRGGRTRLVLANVLVLSARRDDTGSVATVLLPPVAVPAAIAAEGEGSLRLVVRSGGDSAG
jgi:SAF domain